MLIAYVVALGIGGTLVLASMIMGGKDADGDQDADGHHHDAGGDHDHDASHDHDQGGHSHEALVVAGDHAITAHEGGVADAALALLPVTSIRFWTFFMAFFGLTGMTLTLAALGPGVVVNALISAGVGYASGLSVVSVGRKLQKQSYDSSIGHSDYVGANATVSLPVAKGRTGKIRLDIKGRTVELIADTEDEQTYEARQRVMIYQMTPDGRALVTREGEQR